MSTDDEMPRRLTAVIVGAIVLLFALILFADVCPRVGIDEQYSVYSAYLVEGLSHNVHDYGNGTGTVLIASSSAIPSANPRRWAVTSAMNLRRRTNAPSLLVIVRLALTDFRSHPFDRRFDLPNEYHLLDRASLVDPKRQERFPQSAGYHNFSPVSFNRGLTEALFYAEHICGLCGGGEYVLMKKARGKWVVADRYWTWVS